MPSYFSEVAARLLAARDGLSQAQLRELARSIRGELRPALAQVANGSENFELHDAVGILGTAADAFDDAADKLDLAAGRIVFYLADTYTVSAATDPASVAADWTPAPNSVSVPHPATLPPEAMAATLDPAWARRHQATLADRPGSRGATTGLVFFGNDYETDRVVSSGSPATQRSGTGEFPEDRADRGLIAAAILALASSPHMPPSIPHAVPTVADHVEVKVATLMRQRGITYASVVINNTEVCERDFGCRSAVPAILPLGYTLVVWERGAEKPVVLKGKAHP